MFKKSTLNFKLRDGSISAYHKTIVEGEDAIQVSVYYGTQFTHCFPVS